MTRAVPEHHVPHVDRATRELDDPELWAALPELPPFLLADGSGLAEQQTRVRMFQNGFGLYVRFECDDPDIWASYTRRDDPLYEEEVVELFVAPGDQDPERYLEFVINPLGTLYDASIHNPGFDRRALAVDSAWDCPAIRWGARIAEDRSSWSAWLAVPWPALGERQDCEVLRANFYRIERPRGLAAQFSGWAPTLTDPPDFHRPRRFGRLLLGR